MLICLNQPTNTARDILWSLHRWTWSTQPNSNSLAITDSLAKPIAYPNSISHSISNSITIATSISNANTYPNSHSALAYPLS